MAPGFVPLAVRVCLDVLRNMGVHPGPPEVPPQKLYCLLLSEVSSHSAVLFGFENGGDHELGNVEATSVVEYVIELQFQMLGWFDIIGAIWVRAEGTQTYLVMLVQPSSTSDLLKEILLPLYWGNRADPILVSKRYDIILA